ncbi:DUF2793 domain-containing protein [uncultured Brevundimonas sp.]|uniref:DUF2793 domain-containing protein n=1 Tax=uncultured Brevundimonas sp. TaxID=213418 RepID=UPI0025F9505A|nr:DUF2793 domain-containing protein [uncultured Brevundimonas sp.]
MTTTPKLALPFIAQGQAQKEVTHNAGLMLLNTFTQTVVKSRAITAPPGSPANGDSYIVPASASGAWSGHTGQVAVWEFGAWVFYAPFAGWLAYVEAERVIVTYADGLWSSRLAGTANGGGLSLVCVEEEITLSGAFTAAVGGGIIPDRAIVLAVSSRTTQAVTGAPSYDVGVSGNPTQFGGSLGAALGSNNIGVIGPTAFYSPTPVRVTATSGSFTGGKVRVVIQALTFTAPTS